MSAFREGQLDAEREIDRLLSGEWKERNFDSPQDAVFMYGIVREGELRKAILDHEPDEWIERRRGRLSKYD